jgi:hypothetical protein
LSALPQSLAHAAATSRERQGGGNLRSADLRPGALRSSLL